MYAALLLLLLLLIIIIICCCSQSSVPVNASHSCGKRQGKAFLEGAVDSTVGNKKVYKQALLLWPSLTASLSAFSRGKGLLTIGGGKNTMTGPSDFKCTQLKRCMVRSRCCIKLMCPAIAPSESIRPLLSILRLSMVVLASGAQLCHTRALLHPPPHQSGGRHRAHCATGRGRASACTHSGVALCGVAQLLGRGVGQA